MLRTCMHVIDKVQIREYKLGCMHLREHDVYA
jgi:hypothetical protein